MGTKELRDRRESGRRDWGPASEAPFLGNGRWARIPRMVRFVCEMCRQMHPGCRFIQAFRPNSEVDDATVGGHTIVLLDPRIPGIWLLSVR